MDVRLQDDRQYALWADGVAPSLRPPSPGNTVDDLQALTGLTFPVYVGHYRGKVELTAGQGGR